MAAEHALREAYRRVHQAQKLAKRALHPTTFKLLAADFDRLIRQLDKLAQVEHLLGETTTGCPSPGQPL